jgi:hypothetical protein
MARYGKIARAATAMVTALLAVAGCSRPVSGTPVAAPGEVGAAALLRTTCRDYAVMTNNARRDVIAAIGADGNKLIAANPDIWVGVAAALCSFVDPRASVKDVVTGGIR